MVEATIFKKCDRTCHRPETNKRCVTGACQHTCDAIQAERCGHKWTVRYSVNSRQREQSFGELAQAQAFQLTLSAGKQVQGRMFTDPRAGIAEFLPLCGKFIDGMAKAGARTKVIYRSNFANPAVTRLLQGRSVLDVAMMDAEVPSCSTRRWAATRTSTGATSAASSRGPLTSASVRGLSPATPWGASSWDPAW
jgi:hypothetical protein